MLIYHQRVDQGGGTGNQNGVECHLLGPEQILYQRQSQNRKIPVGQAVDECRRYFIGTLQHPGHEIKGEKEYENQRKLHKDDGLQLKVFGKIRVIYVAE